jgi:hypothetical protein
MFIGIRAEEPERLCPHLPPYRQDKRGVVPMEASDMNP